MPAFLGLDIGTNSVGSAWVDTDRNAVHLAVTVFPAGVDDKRESRAKKRREKRSLRRAIARKASRKRRLSAALHEAGLLPAAKSGEPAFDALMAADPWELRRLALTRPITAHEFGRILVHLNQRRGWQAGIEDEDEDKKKDEGKIKEAVKKLRALMRETHAETVGQLMAQLGADRVRPKYRDPIRNRADSYEFHAEREMIREEFDTLWRRQAESDSPLARLLTDSVRDTIEGILFFQRPTYWKTSSLGRCDLEPTDRECPKADMHAQHFLMLETVNRVRLNGERLDAGQRQAVIGLLTHEERVTVTKLRKALGVKRGHGELNVERERKPEINTDWFSAAIVHGVFGPERWVTLPDAAKQSVNRAVQKFGEADEARLRRDAPQWWALSPEEADRFIAALRRKPRDTVSLSRKAILNLLPHMEQGDDVTTAKQKCGYPPQGFRLNKATRHFLAKHPEQLPPAPDLPNPIVRKALHEARRHVQAYIERFGRKPDRIVVELAREARQPKRVRDEKLKANRRREDERKQIIETHLKPNSVEESQWPKAVDRVLLHQRQAGMCPYTGLGSGEAPCISMHDVVLGNDVEVDHIVPYSRSFDNSLDNKLLCRRDANRNKGDRTPREWLTEEQFHELELRLKHFEKAHARAWENLHRDALALDDFVSSQLTDTGYITRQVVAYLRETLFPGRPHDVLCTKGVYTAILRRDWGILEEKRRDDHRHHALDAVAIALTDRSRLQTLARLAQAQEAARAREGKWPSREAMKPPWDGFRQQVMDAAADLVVAHRPQRALTGAFHEDTLFGAVPGYEGVFCRRVPVALLTPKMLLEPREVTVGGRKTLNMGKGGVVRDARLRQHIRAWLEARLRETGRHEPVERLSPGDMKALLKGAQLTMPSGVPIRRVRLLKKIEDPVEIGGDPRHPRFYIGGNNHHFEIVQDEGTGRWRGRGVKMFDVARRIHPPKGQPRLPAILGTKAPVLAEQGLLSADDQRFYRGTRFVMALCKGDTLLMKDPDVKDPDAAAQGYFVVVKINPESVEMVEHWDARPATATDRQPPRRLIPIRPEHLRGLGARKARVGALGEVDMA
ncbi:MAG TPA: type II CRISPR RNA-guided endonuclease Cas9 [Planctomycetota bacterium]|nr:type II CRISPR RNA-guided endonuclease Cas9 [Planctomycetota bacterium]